MKGVAGNWVGPPDLGGKPYELVKFAASGGEGELWRARMDGTTQEWAIKIFHDVFVQAEPLQADGDPANAGTARRAEVSEERQNAFARRVRRSQLELSALQGIPGIAFGVEAFADIPPYPPGTRPAGPKSVVYSVSRWQPGEDLDKWVERRAREGDIAEPAVVVESMHVISELCRIVDAVASRERSHLDIAPANVMVHGEEVTLIDFSFLRAVDASVRTRVHHGVWTAPEFLDDGVDRRALDRFAVGAVSGYLLTGVRPTSGRVEESTFDALIRAGFGEDVATHVSWMVAKDIARRPEALRPWAAELEKLLKSDDRPKAELLDLNAAMDASGTTVVAVSAVDRIWTATLSNRDQWSLRRVAAVPGGTWLGAARDGAGEVVVVGLTGSGTVHAGRNGGSVPLFSDIRVGGGLAVTGSGDGSVDIAAINSAGELIVASLDLSGAVRLRPSGVYGIRALAMIDLHGVAAVVLAQEAGTVFVRLDGSDPEPLSDISAEVADVGIGPYGDAQVVIARSGSHGPVQFVEQIFDGWGVPETLQLARPTNDVAIWCDERQSVIAVAGADGVSVARREDRAIGSFERCLDQATARIVLVAGTRRDLRMIALSHDRRIRILEPQGGVWTRVDELAAR